MPAIQVARTDTFENQRQKINQIGDQIFSISQGGSDLSTGNLKIGDGTIAAPSLSFTSDASVGIYKPSAGSLGFVSSNKKILDLEPANVVFYKDVKVRQRILYDAGVSILNTGANYDTGTYENIALTGGTGDDATADIVITEYEGSITQTGAGYNPGTYSSVPFPGGNGSGALISFTVPGIVGALVGGSGYVPGTYTGVPITGGTGSNAVADIIVTGSTGFNGTIVGGSGYTDGTYQGVSTYNQPIQTFVVTVTGSGPFQYVIDGNTQPALTLDTGNTYKFDISDASNVGHPFRFETQFGGDLNPGDAPGVTGVRVGNPGTAGAFYYVVVKGSSTATTVNYDCEVHNNMGAGVTIQSGTTVHEGTGGTADVTVSGGAVTAVVFTTADDYATGDIVEFNSADIGGTGSGSTFTLTTNSFNGVVSSITFTSIGSGYVDTDVLSANDSDLGGGGGAGFTYTVNSNPGVLTEITTFDNKGSGYTANDVLSLSAGVTGVAATLPGQKNNVSTTLSTGSAQITVADTTGIVAGMNVFNGQSDVGILQPSTTVQSVDNATQLTLSAIPGTAGAATLSFSSPNLFDITVASVAGINTGDLVTKTAGAGVLAADTTVVTITGNVITLSNTPTTAGAATLSFSPSYGSPSTPLEYTIAKVGAVESLSINSPGNGYVVGDSLGVSPFDLTQSISYTVTRRDVVEFTLTTTVPSNTFAVGDVLVESGVTQGSSTEIVEIRSIGGNVNSLLCTSTGLAAGSVFEKDSAPGPTYTINTFTDLETKIFIDTGSGATVTPDLTLYVGNTYSFDLSDSSNDSQEFAFSKFAGGKWGTSSIGPLTTTLDVGSANVTVTSTTGIVVGMLVSASGQGGGSLVTGTKVAAVVDATTVTLDTAPSVSGATELNFEGTEFTDGVTSDGSNINIKITDSTPNLYYYDRLQADQGGEVGSEALLTIDANNPKVFGSGFVLSVLATQQTDIISSDISSGEFSAASITSTSSVNGVDATLTGSVTTPQLNGTNVVASSISSQTSLTISGTAVTVNAPFNVGANVSVASTTGNVTTSGYVKTTAFLNVNDKILLEENEIQTTTGNDLVFKPVAGRIAKVDGTQALVLPVGNTSERPQSPIAQNGAIRFNTDNNQYEGYNSTTTSWSSLGGVRDIDGNTYILAELTAGANDNTLWFYNDAVNTLKLTPQFLDFRGVKKISSGKLGLPAFTEWAANTAVTTGQYLKYKNNLYEVTSNGTTASSGSEPTHTSGVQNNGTAQLTWSAIAVDSLTFEEISELRVGPNKDCPLVIGSELKLDDNTISTQVQDLVLRPNAGKQTIVDSVTHFRIPAGTDNEKSIAVAGAGSIRFNTTIQQFEGYSGTNWSSLGGVRDVDGNTYIIPETAPAANENILYFYNNNVNTLQLSSTSLDFTGIDSITTSGGNSLALNTEIVTFNSVDTTIDNSDSTSTFISGTKQYLDLGLSSGLNTDPILRLDDQGDVYLNTTFGTGSFNGVKIFDGDLKEFELADYKIKSSTFTLDKGGLESSAVVLYPSGTSKGCEVTVVSKSSSGKRSMSKYSVIDNGTDIFHNEYASLNTSSDQYTAAFDFTASTEPRITLTLSNDHAVADVINFTVLVQELK